MMQAHIAQSPSTDLRPDASDVCVIVEGCYPFVSGGVSSWLNWLIRSQAPLRFSVVAITSGLGPRSARYERPANLVAFHELNIANPVVLAGHGEPPPISHLSASDELADAMCGLVSGGGAAEYREVLRRVRALGPAADVATLLNSPLAWRMVQRMYETLAPRASFLQFFWAWRALIGGLMSVSTFPLPEAKAYHAISAGYAGLLSARAAIETGKPAILTEHGIYTNERRIDLMMARWLSDTIEKGNGIRSSQSDVRDIWIDAFSSFARCCYQESTLTIALFHGNQPMQRALGASDARMRVIPNGIDVSSFKDMSRPAADERPTVALIGRVSPIKDVRTFVSAIGHVRDAVPDIRALVMGATDEDAAYAEECQHLVRERGLDDCIEFTGAVRIAEYMPSIHVVVLTSLSEAQPLVVLEAGAAAIPCVVTDVGCCRELVEGTSEEDRSLGAGGIVTDVIAADQIASALIRLLTHHDEREAMGRALKLRVSKYYTEAAARSAYSELYASCIANGADRSEGCG